MLKSEPSGAPKKRPFGRPLVQGVLKKSSSPVQTAIKASHENGGLFAFLYCCFENTGGGFPRSFGAVQTAK